MKWIAIAGTWKITNAEVEKDVRSTVKSIVSLGDGVVTGGALGVDFFATDEFLKHDSTASKLKIFLPSTLEGYSAHYRLRAAEGKITTDQAESLISQLENVKALNPSSIIEDRSVTNLDMTAYYNRITKIIAAADELVAFQVNLSEGTQDTINKAEKKGIFVRRFSYLIAEDK